MSSGRARTHDHVHQIGSQAPYPVAPHRSIYQAIYLHCYLRISNKQKPMHYYYYYYSVLNIENVRCVVAIDNDYEAVLIMAQESRYALYILILKFSNILFHDIQIFDVWILCLEYSTFGVNYRLHCRVSRSNRILFLCCFCF